MRTVIAVFAVCSFSVCMPGADNPYFGTWKLNTAKSKYNPDPGMKEETIKFEADGNNVRRIASGTDGNGKPIDEGGPEGASFPWDGEFHTVTKPSAKPEVQVAVKVVDPRHLIVTVKVDGKVVDNDRSTVSKDGKTITDTDNGIDMNGKKTHNVEVFEKQ